MPYLVQGTLDIDTRPPKRKKRKRPGPKPKSGIRDVPHRARPVHKAFQPVHAVWRTVEGLGRLRRGKVLAAIRRALSVCLAREEFRVVHLSIQHNHLHLLVEAASASALSEGMKALGTSAARSINRVMARSGKVFRYRYSATAITSPRQARNALAYVLNNWRRHNEDERALESRASMFDPYATGWQWDGWVQKRKVLLSPWPDPLPVKEPATWLLRVGWQKAAVGVSAWATPQHAPQ